MHHAGEEAHPHARSMSNAISERSATRACLILVLAVVVVAAAETKMYSGQYDDLDVEGILQSEELRQQYYNCFMDTGPCPSDAAAFFKKNAPEAVVTSCRYCTEKQLEMFEKIITWYVDNKPNEWNALIEKTIADARKQGVKLN